MSVDPASFKIRFKEFACEPDAQIQVFIDDSIVILNEAFWAIKYDLGVSYLTAHFLALSKRSEAGSTTSVPTSGPISSKSVDGVSVSYASYNVQDVDESFYMSTPYGQRYLQLRSNLGIAAYIV